MMGSLTSLGGTKTGIISEENPVEDGHMFRIQGQGYDVCHHLMRNFIGNHVALAWS